MARVGTTTINVSGMKRMEREVRNGLRSTGPSPIRNGFKQWGERFRGFSNERYDRFSRGGGNWKGLAESTKKARRHGKGGRYQRGGKAFAKAISSGGGQISILVNKGHLKKAFSPTFMRIAGQLEKHVPFGIVVGFGGPGQHPEGKMTVAKLAGIHHAGLGHNPERKLVVDPPDYLKKLMAGDMERAMQKIIDRSQIEAS